VWCVSTPTEEDVRNVVRQHVQMAQLGIAGRGAEQSDVRCNMDRAERMQRNPYLFGIRINANVGETPTERAQYEALLRCRAILGRIDESEADFVNVVRRNEAVVLRRLEEKYGLDGETCLKEADEKFVRCGAEPRSEREPETKAVGGSMSDKAVVKQGEKERRDEEQRAEAEAVRIAAEAEAAMVEAEEQRAEAEAVRIAAEAEATMVGAEKQRAEAEAVRIAAEAEAVMVEAEEQRAEAEVVRIAAEAESTMEVEDAWEVVLQVVAARQAKAEAVVTVELGSETAAEQHSGAVELKLEIRAEQNPVDAEQRAKKKEKEKRRRAHRRAKKRHKIGGGRS
jgi:hypothetical protein